MSQRIRRSALHGSATWLGCHGQPTTTIAQGESAENLALMHLLDQQYTDTPYYGVRRMTAWFRSQGYAVNHKRVARLLRYYGVRDALSQTTDE